MKTPRFKAWHSGIGEMFSPEKLMQSEVMIAPDGSGFIGFDAMKGEKMQRMDWLVPIESTGIFHKKTEAEFWNGDVIAMGLDEDNVPFGAGMIRMKNGRWICEFFGETPWLNENFVDWLDQAVFIEHVLESAEHCKKFKDSTAEL